MNRREKEETMIDIEKYERRGDRKKWKWGPGGTRYAHFFVSLISENED